MLKNLIVIYCNLSTIIKLINIAMKCMKNIQTKFRITKNQCHYFYLKKRQKHVPTIYNYFTPYQQKRKVGKEKISNNIY